MAARKCSARTAPLIKCRAHENTPVKARDDQKGPIVAEPLHTANLPGDPRGADLQSQIQDLSAALQNWRRTREYSRQTEERLAQITLQCARIVESWQETERRNTAVTGPSERRPWVVENRAPQDTAERIRALERTIEHEWEALREDQDEPAKQPAGQAGTADGSTTASLTLRGFESVEARLGALEQDIQSRMAQLSGDLQAVIAELRTTRPPAAPAAAPAFPLESVMRIHEELREADATATPGAEALKPGATRALPESTDASTALTARMESLERAVSDVAAVQPARGWRPLYAVVGLLLALGGMALVGVWMQRRVDARLNEAAAQVLAAERQRDATTAATREEAARQVADAQQSAAQAQVVGNVLAAPDRVRYWLTGADATSRAYGQVLFSRSRGIVFSALRLPAAGPGKTYQLWLITINGPVSAGLISPDSAGRVTLATDALPTFQGRLTGALVTLEPDGGAPRPSADQVLIKVE